MYCNNCGKHNPEGSKFCQHCGIKFNEHHATSEHTQVEHDASSELLTSDTTPYPYVISISKLIILSIATFSIYDIYWFYKQWKSFKAERDLKVTPWARALFATLMSYSLFKEVSKAIKSLDKTRGLEAGGLAIAYFILVALWRLPDPWWWLSMLSVLPLIPVQNTINSYWEQKYGDKVVKSGFGAWNWIWTIIGGIVIILALYGTFGSDLTESTSTGVDTSTGTYNTSTSGLSAFKESYKTSFIESCNESADVDSSQYCGCLADYMVNNYTEAQLTQITEEYNRTQETPQELEDGASSCISQ